jgi:diguanylate cyclase (GGDEF)-like protein
LSEVNYDRKRVFPVPLNAVAEDGTLVLALRVWGGDEAAVTAWGGGPYEGEFSLGDYRVLLLDGIVSEVPGLIFSVLFVGFGLYYLYLYRRNSQLRTYLWFGLMAANIGIYGLMLSQWKYLLDWPFITFKKIEFGVIYVFPALAIQMLWALLQQPISRWLRAYQVSFIAVSILVVVVPGHAIHYYTLGYWQLWTLPLLVLAPWLVLREARAGKGEARTLLGGLLIFVATCVNDLLIDLAGLETTRLIPYGFVAIMVAMAVSLANRFTTMLNELEYEVAERTAELSAANALLAEAARVDPLTSLLNRRGFTEEADAEVQRVLRTDRGFTVILADVDNFKSFNDSHGHACGDHVLKRLAAIFGASVRDVDRVARWGGEEFILLLPETELEGAAVLAEKLRQGIAGNMFEFGGQRLSITMTFGVAGYRKGETLDACIARADAALYHGKERGRNQVMVGNCNGLTLVS